MWTDNFFDLNYYQLFLEPKESGHAAVAKSLITEFSLQGKKGIDVGCGVGNLANQLAQQGCVMSAFDIARDYVEVGLTRNYSINLYKASMLDPYPEDNYDFVLNYNSSWGYFSHENNLQALRHMANALKHGGQVILELYQPIYIINHYNPCITYVLKNSSSGISYTIKRTSELEYLPNLAMKQRWEVTSLDGIKVDNSYIRLYFPGDLVEMLTSVGFTNIRFTDHTYQEFKPFTTERLIVSAIKL